MTRTRDRLAYTNVDYLVALSTRPNVLLKARRKTRTALALFVDKVHARRGQVDVPVRDAVPVLQAAKRGAGTSGFFTVSHVPEFSARIREKI